MHKFFLSGGIMCIAVCGGGMVGSVIVSSLPHNHHNHQPIQSSQLLFLLPFLLFFFLSLFPLPLFLPLSLLPFPSSHSFFLPLILFPFFVPFPSPPLSLHLPSIYPSSFFFSSHLPLCFISFHSLSLPFFIPLPLSFSPSRLFPFPSPISPFPFHYPSSFSVPFLLFHFSPLLPSPFSSSISLPFFLPLPLSPFPFLSLSVFLLLSTSSPLLLLLFLLLSSSSLLYPFSCPLPLINSLSFPISSPYLSRLLLSPAHLSFNSPSPSSLPSLHLSHPSCSSLPETNRISSSGTTKTSSNLSITIPTNLHLKQTV